MGRSRAPGGVLNMQDMYVKKKNIDDETKTKNKTETRINIVFKFTFSFASNIFAKKDYFESSVTALK